MNTCLACKNKTNNERCMRASITGLAFCGLHARSKVPRIWSIVNNVGKHVALISKVWRGYRVRRLLKLAGPGVLKRSMCHNDEELVSMDEKDKIHPFDYFSFEEAGKIWWFDIRSMIGCLNASFIPKNPYTRNPLSIDTRYRLRLLYKYRIHNRLPTLHEPQKKRSLQELVNYQWMRVCQVMYENGFEDFTPETFTSIEPRSVFFMFLITFIRTDLCDIAYRHGPSSKYHRFTQLLKREIQTFEATAAPSVQTATALMILLNDVEDAFHVCAAIARSVARL